MFSNASRRLPLQPSDSEFRKFVDDYMNNFSIFGHGSATISKEKNIQWPEEFIEMLKKMVFPDKEKDLKEAIEELKKLKDDNRTPPRVPE